MTGSAGPRLDASRQRGRSIRLPPSRAVSPRRQDGGCCTSRSSARDRLGAEHRPGFWTDGRARRRTRVARRPLLAGPELAGGGDARGLGVVPGNLQAAALAPRADDLRRAAAEVGDHLAGAPAGCAGHGLAGLRLIGRRHLRRTLHNATIASADATGRYAPSPTGTLHLGNLRTALLAWLFARSQGAAFRMRIDDLDRGRVRPGVAERAARRPRGARPGLGRPGRAPVRPARALRRGDRPPRRRTIGCTPATARAPRSARPRRRRTARCPRAPTPGRAAS